LWRATPFFKASAINPRPAVTTFYLIRHAERLGDQAMLVGRSGGLHLSSPGKIQAERLANHLAREPISHVLSSPVERARETAAPLARRLGVTVDIAPALTEINSGAWTGRTFPELDATDAQWRRFNQLRSLTRIPSGETMVEVQARFVSEMLRLQEEFPHAGIALVSHSDPIKIALACFLGAPLDFYDRLEIGLGSVSVVTLGPGGAKVMRLNDTPRPEMPAA
jgi:broad specificity phosphatase PhoE